MNNLAAKKLDLYTYIETIDEKSIDSIIEYIKGLVKGKKIMIQLNGRIKDYKFDYNKNDLKEIRNQTWQHLENEFNNE